MRFRSVSFITIIAFIAVLLTAACQRAASSEYTKYESDAAVPRISAEDAKKEVDAGTAIFVDSRGQAAYDQEHLPGAMVLTMTDDESKYSTLPKGKKIIVYCS